jgi:hypothetical protein
MQEAIDFCLVRIGQDGMQIQWHCAVAEGGNGEIA